MAAPPLPSSSSTSSSRLSVAPSLSRATSLSSANTPITSNNGSINGNGNGGNGSNGNGEASSLLSFQLYPLFFIDNGHITSMVTYDSFIYIGSSTGVIYKYHLHYNNGYDEPNRSRRSTAATNNTNDTNNSSSNSNNLNNGNGNGTSSSAPLSIPTSTRTVSGPLPITPSSAAATARSNNNGSGGAGYSLAGSLSTLTLGSPAFTMPSSVPVNVPTPAAKNTKVQSSPTHTVLPSSSLSSSADMMNGVGNGNGNGTATGAPSSLSFSSSIGNGLTLSTSSSSIPSSSPPSSSSSSLSLASPRPAVSSPMAGMGMGIPLDRSSSLSSGTVTNSLVTSAPLLPRSASSLASSISTPRAGGGTSVTAPSPSSSSLSHSVHHQRAISVSSTRVPLSSIDVSFGSATPRSNSSSNAAAAAASAAGSGGNGNGGHGRSLADLDVIFKADSKLQVDIRSHHSHDKRIPVTLPIQQFEVCVPLGCLFVLCDGILCMYRLEDLSHVWTFKGAIGKNVSAFSVRLIEKDMVVKMGIATARRVYVFRQSLGVGYTWTQEQELMIPEAVRTLQWLSDISLCVGFKKEYTVINILQGAVNDLSPISNHGMALMKRLGKSDVWFMSLGLEGVMFNSNASPARLKRVLVWPEPPRALGASGSYILSLLSKEIVVHKLKTNREVLSGLQLIHTLPIVNGSVMCDGPQALVLLSQKQQLYVLQPMSLADKLRDESWVTKLAATDSKELADDMVTHHISLIMATSYHPLGQMAIRYAKYCAMKYQPPLSSPSSSLSSSAGNAANLRAYQTLLADVSATTRTFIQRLSGISQSLWRVLKDKELIQLCERCIEQHVFRLIYPTIYELYRLSNAADDASFVVSCSSLSSYTPTDFGSDLLKHGNATEMALYRAKLRFTRRVTLGASRIISPRASTAASSSSVATPLTNNFLGSPTSPMVATAISSSSSSLSSPSQSSITRPISSSVSSPSLLTVSLNAHAAQSAAAAAAAAQMNHNNNSNLSASSSSSSISTTVPPSPLPITTIASPSTLPPIVVITTTTTNNNNNNNADDSDSDDDGEGDAIPSDHERLAPFGRCITAMASLPRYHSPSAKIRALGDIHNILCECAEEVWSQCHSKKLVLSADMLLPILVYVLIQSKMVNPHSECGFISDFTSPEDMLGHSGYMAVSFQIALRHIQELGDKPSIGTHSHTHGTSNTNGHSTPKSSTTSGKQALATALGPTAIRSPPTPPPTTPTNNGNGNGNGGVGNGQPTSPTSSSSSSIASMGMVDTLMVTSFAFQALKPPQLSYDAGTLLLVKLVAGKNWLQARNPLTGEQGTVAASYIVAAAPGTSVPYAPPTPTPVPTPVPVPTTIESKSGVTPVVAPSPTRFPVTVTAIIHSPTISDGGTSSSSLSMRHHGHDHNGMDDIRAAQQRRRTESMAQLFDNADANSAEDELFQHTI